MMQLCTVRCDLFRTMWRWREKRTRRDGSCIKKGRTEYNRRCNTRTEFPSWPPAHPLACRASFTNVGVASNVETLWNSELVIVQSGGVRR